MSDSVFCVAHRGFANSFVENTDAALLAAAEAGADAIEIDVRVTADNVPVLLHDSTLRRTHGLDQRIDTITFSQMQCLLSRQAKPSLTTLYDAVQLVSVPLIVDIKVNEPNALRAVVDSCSNGALRRCWLQSSCVGTLHWLREQLGADQWLMALLDAGTDSDATLWDVSQHNFGINVDFLHFDAERHADLLQRVASDTTPLAKSCWTLNCERDVEAAVRLGYTGIVSDTVDCIDWLQQ
jgi:glycerophosphoryl diester phosphodiesterase